MYPVHVHVSRTCTCILYKLFRLDDPTVQCDLQHHKSCYYSVYRVHAHVHVQDEWVVNLLYCTVYMYMLCTVWFYIIESN